MKKVLYIVIAMLVLPRLYDFVYHGGHAYDLLGATGFAVLFFGGVLDERARMTCPPPAALRRRANVVTACGFVLVLGSFLLQWKVFG